MVFGAALDIRKKAAAKKVGIGFGHTDFQELLPLAKKAKELGVRATLDHPLLELNKLLLDEMKQLADLGVYVGTYCQPMIHSLYQPVADAMETVKTIKEIGADRCIIGSDFGQVLHMDVRLITQNSNGYFTPRYSANASIWRARSTIGMSRS